MNTENNKLSTPAVVIPLNAKKENIWEDICNKVINDALFEQKSVAETIEFFKSKYKIENK